MQGSDLWWMYLYRHTHAVLRQLFMAGTISVMAVMMFLTEGHRSDVEEMGRTSIEAPMKVKTAGQPDKSQPADLLNGELRWTCVVMGSCAEFFGDT